MNSASTVAQHGGTNVAEACSLSLCFCSCLRGKWAILSWAPTDLQVIEIVGLLNFDPVPCRRVRDFFLPDVAAWSGCGARGDRAFPVSIGPSWLKSQRKGPASRRPFRRHLSLDRSAASGCTAGARPCAGAHAAAGGSAGSTRGRRSHAGAGRCAGCRSRRAFHALLGIALHAARVVHVALRASTTGRGLRQSGPGKSDGKRGGKRQSFGSHGGFHPCLSLNRTNAG
ncbi:hypothetical protein PKCBPO_03933 [Methylorubrum thiocyanatum]